MCLCGVGKLQLRPADESLQLEGKELAFFSLLDTLERSLHWHLVEETGKFLDNTLEVCDCGLKRLAIPWTLPVVCPLLGLKVLEMKLGSSVLKHVTE